MEWTTSNENICRDIALEAEIFYLCHNESYRNYKRKSMWFVIPTILLSSVVGGLSFNEDFNSNNNCKIALASVNIFIAVLNSLFKIFNIDDYITNHFYLSKMWYSLYEKIRIELARIPYERIQCGIFIKEIIDIKLALIEKNIILDRDIIKKYKNKYKNNNFDLPLALNHLSPIQIYNRDCILPITPIISSNNTSILSYAV
jgi:hypothetical protein